MLSKEELQKIIDKFDEEELKRQGIFGIFPEDYGESFIRANKEGLELFTLKLLKSILEIDEILSDPDKDIIPFNNDEDWVDENSNTFIQYIKPIAYKEKLNPKIESKLTFIDKLKQYCNGFIVIFIIIFIIISLVVGFFTVINWIF